MKWYKQKYVNTAVWILDNLEYLGLTSDEAIILLLIDHMNQFNEDISLDILKKKTDMTTEQLDKTISTLCAKKYLEIRATSKNVKFNLEGLYETEVAQTERVLDTSLFDLFESEFSRPLTNKEMEKLSDWAKTMDSKLIVYALREASMYQNVKMPYIEKILNSWISKGYTSKMIEEGKVN